MLRIRKPLLANLHNLHLVARETTWPHDLPKTENEVTFQYLKDKYKTYQPQKAPLGILDQLWYREIDLSNPNFKRTFGWLENDDQTLWGPIMRYEKKCVRVFQRAFQDDTRMYAYYDSYEAWFDVIFGWVVGFCAILLPFHVYFFVFGKSGLSITH